MSKYGFNENELVKTVTDMIEKDGFHKREVTYGKQGGASSASFAVGTMKTENKHNSDKEDVMLFAINFPEDTNGILCIIHPDDVDFEYEVGDTLSPSDIMTYSGDIEFGPGIVGAPIVFALDEAPYEPFGTRYYHVYAADAEDKVMARAKAVAEELDNSEDTI